MNNIIKKFEKEIGRKLTQDELNKDHFCSHCEVELPIEKMHPTIFWSADFYDNSCKDCHEKSNANFNSMCR